MRARAFLFGPLVALASVVAAGPIQAQTEVPTGSRTARAAPADIPETAGLTDQDRARIAVNSYAQCIVTRDPAKAERVLAIKPSDPARAQALNGLATEECLRFGELRMPHELLRGAMFRALYRRSFAGQAPSLGEKPFDFTTTVADTVDPGNRLYLTLRGFADCVVRADPRDAQALMLQDPGSKGENAAFAGLAPHLGPCFPQGLKVTFNREMIVALLAEALYREAQAGVGASGARKS